MIAESLVTLALLWPEPARAIDFGEPAFPRHIFGPPVAPAPPAAPAVYRLADVSGIVWTHADPAYLESFVANRNTALAVPVVPVYVTPVRTVRGLVRILPWRGRATGSCANGSCGR